MRTLGLHLQQSPALAAAGRPSALAELDPSGGLADLRFLTTDHDILAVLGTAPGLVVMDAPVAIPNERGRRPIEEVLAWCDVPAFPISRARMHQVFGGCRGEELARSAPADVRVAESLPDLVLRLFLWGEMPDLAVEDVAAYRERWLGVRPPRFRPKGAGRALGAGVRDAWSVLAGHIELHGWVPETADDWATIRSAAAIDAIACAHVAWRAVHRPDSVRTIAVAEGAAALIPVDLHLRGRLELHLAQLGVGP